MVDAGARLHLDVIDIFSPPHLGLVTLLGLR